MRVPSFVRSTMEDGDANDTGDGRYRRHRQGSLRSARAIRSFAVAGGARRNKLRELCADLTARHGGVHSCFGVDMTDDESVVGFADRLAASGSVPDGVVLMPPQDPPTNDPLPSRREVARDSAKQFHRSAVVAQGRHRGDETRCCERQAGQGRHHLGNLFGPGDGSLRIEQRDSMRMACRGQDACIRAG